MWAACFYSIKENPLENWFNLTTFGLTQVFVLVGLFGLLVPIFPGLVVMWLAILGYGVVTGFASPGVVIFILITILMLAGTFVDNIMMGVGARQGGASWGAILIALLAGVLGTIFFPPLGGVVAAPAAVFLFEYLRLKDVQKAWLALKGLATGVGFILL